MVSFLLLAMSILPADVDSDAAAALALAQARVNPQTQLDTDSTPMSTPMSSPPRSAYEDAKAQAEKAGWPLVVFVGVPIRPVPGTIAVRVDRLSDGTANAIIVSTDAATGYWLAPTATDAEIARLAVKPNEARPFAPPSERQPALPTADDDGKPAGPWAEDIDYPAGMVRYLPTQYTQEIAVTNDRDRISKVSRFNLASKWHQPGGMEGIVGWRSDLYKLIPTPPRVFIGNIAVWNGANFQNNRGWRREYADGTQFHDVLSYRGVVFEHRKRQKIAGKWESLVIHKNIAARPPGYVGLQGQTCASCHSESGSGGYGVGLIPGGDETLSDPFDGLEAGVSPSMFTGGMSRRRR